VVPTGPTSGLIEVVQRAATIADIQKSYGGGAVRCCCCLFVCVFVCLFGCCEILVVVVVVDDDDVVVVDVVVNAQRLIVGSVLEIVGYEISQRSQRHARQVSGRRRSLSPHLRRLLW
jgi:hypothetical protein